MSGTKPKKKFDALAFKERVQAEIYEEIKDMTPAEQIAYFNRRAAQGPLGEWWKRIRRRSARAHAGAGRK